MSSTKPRYAYTDESGDAGYDFGANSSRCSMAKEKKLLQLAFQASRLQGDDDSLEERNGKPFGRSYYGPNCLATQKR
jgi:hypothetical protein